MKILFCTDGSKISFNSIKNLSKWINKAEVDIICAVDFSMLSDEIAIENVNFTSTCANVADNILDFAENEITKLGFNVSNKIKECGSAIDSIIEQSNKKNYDLIALGSHGKKGLQKWLGSVSQEIITNSNASNYVAKTENNAKKMLIATDGTDCSINILKNLISSLKLDDKEIYICFVNDDPNLLFLEGVDSSWLIEIQKKQQIYASKAIKNLQDILNEHQIKVKESIILTGIPAQKIIDYSRKKEIDLVLLGSRHKSKLDKFLSSSVSKRVSENLESDIWLQKC